MVFLWFSFGAIAFCFVIMFLLFSYGFRFSHGFPVVSLWGQNLKGRPPRKRNVSRGGASPPSPPPAWHNWLIYLNNLPTIKCKLFNARAICLHLLHCGTPPPLPLQVDFDLRAPLGPPSPPSVQVNLRQCETNQPLMRKG